MRYFYIALAETKWLEDIFAKIKEYDDVLRGARGIRVGVLIRYAKWRRVCIPCKLAEAYDVPLFVDNGAFEFLSKSDLEERELPMDKLRRWVYDYARWLSTWHNYVTAAALPDVPVHGADFLPADVRLERIVLTNKLHLMAARLLRRSGALGKTIIVIQGFEVHEYQLSASLNLTPELVETCTLSGGCPYRGIVGVGSVCVRKPSAKGKTALLAGGRAAGTLRGFMHGFLSARWPREIRGFHFFGLHTDAVRAFAMHERYFASDTGAHGLNYKYKWRTFLGCSELDKQCYVRAIEDQLRRTLAPLLNASLTGPAASQTAL